MEKDPEFKLTGVAPGIFDHYGVVAKVKRIADRVFRLLLSLSPLEALPSSLLELRTYRCVRATSSGLKASSLPICCSELKCFIWQTLNAKSGCFNSGVHFSA